MGKKTAGANKHCVIVGSGPAGLGTAFHLLAGSAGWDITIIEKEKYSTGGLRNDCKMNFTYPIGFPKNQWKKEEADHYLKLVEEILHPPCKKKHNLSIYEKRADNLGVKLINIRQAHLGTDGGLRLIKNLTAELEDKGVEIALGEKAESIDTDRNILKTDSREIHFDALVLAPGRKGFGFLQKIMNSLEVPYLDNVVDVGVRLEMTEDHYSIVRDYYDPKFLFPGNVRTFCTNSGAAHVVQEQYETEFGRTFYSVNGHAWADPGKENGLVNFSILKTVNLTEPLASGHLYAVMLGQMAYLLGGGHPIMQRVGDFRLGKRSKAESFNGDLYNFAPTLPSCTPGDIALAVPAKILRVVWKAMKLLDTIIPGVLHPSTIFYYPEIKMYANRPRFRDNSFRVADGIYMIGDGAGTSRGITAAWASGIRAADSILGS
jgi:uncharacterized FAD-dependent dehydrogenase